MVPDKERLAEIYANIRKTRDLLSKTPWKVGSETRRNLQASLDYALYESQRLQEAATFCERYAFISFFEHTMSVTLKYTATIDDEGGYQPTGIPDKKYNGPESDNFWIENQFYEAVSREYPSPHPEGWEDWTTEEVTVKTVTMDSYLGHPPQHPLRALFEGYNHSNAEDWEKMWVLIKSIKPEFHNQGFALLEGLLEGSSDMRKALITNAEAKPLLDTLDFLCGGMWMAYYYQDDQYDLEDDQSREEIYEIFNFGEDLLSGFNVHSTILNLVNGWVERAKELEQETHNDT